MKSLVLKGENNIYINMPVIGFGAMGISEFYGSSNFEEAQKAINTAIENGVIHFDTADGYAFGDNERYLKSALNLTNPESRKRLIIASKAGIVRDKLDPTIRGINIDPSYLAGQLERSLKNLGTDYLDIFYIHRLPPNASKIELQDLAEYLNQVKKSGKAKFIGLSEPKLEQLQTIDRICKIGFVQSEFSLLERAVESNGILSYCKENEIQFVAYSPLCRGMLTDNFDPANLESGDFRNSLPRFEGENFAHNYSIVQKLASIAGRKGSSMAALAVAWLIEKGAIVIPGMRKSSRVTNILTALELSLSDQDIQEIDNIAFSNAAVGTRYSSVAMKEYGFE